MHDGMLAEFQAPEALLEAARRVRELGCTRIDAFTPFPIEGLAETLRLRRSRIPAAVFVGGLCGGLGAYLLQWWTAAIDYPLNVGGRPLHSAPAFIPITFEMTVLFAALTSFVSFLWVSKLPRLAHPVFSIEGFERASIDRFWLGIDATDPLAEDHSLVDALMSAGALRVVRTRSSR